MSTQTVYDPAWKSGPDTRSTEPPPDYTDLCLYAEDECYAAWRLRRDDPAVELKLRREALLRAQDYITEALAMMEAKV